MIIMNNKIIFYVKVIALGLLINGSISAQNICDNATFEKGGFNLNLSEICGTQVLNVTNTATSLLNIKYVFDYQGETLESTIDSAVAQLSHTYPLLYQPKVYTVAQIGEKNGKVSIACKNVTVRSNNVPVHSYNVCSSQIELVIPLNPSNNFDVYTIILGTGQPPVTVLSTELPFSLKKSLTFPNSYSVTGKYNDPTKNCSTSAITTKTIPAEVVARDLPYAPNIDKVELLSLQKVKIDYTGPFSTDPNTRYGLFSYPKGEYTNAKEIIPDLLPGRYQLDIPDTTKAYCFIVRKNQACGALKEESGEICTLPIYSVVRNPFNITNEINWEPYPITHKGFTVESLGALSSSTYKTAGALCISNSTRPIQIIPINSSENPYIDRPIICSDVYTYKLKQTIQGTYRFVKFTGLSISNRVSLDPAKTVPPTITDLWVSTNANINKINFEDNLNEWPIEKQQWFLWKKSGSNFMKIDSVPKGSYLITDPKTSSQSESYAISFKDNCGSFSGISNSVSSIYLTFEADAKLKWTGDNPFAKDNITKYELIATDKLSGTEQSRIVENKQNLENTINLSLYETDPTFEVSAIGVKHQSSSNSITIPIPPNIYIPNAFSPNNDGINDKLEIKTLIKTIDTFEMKIWNRQGEQVGEILSPNGTWDGTLKNVPLPAGLYTYSISVKLKNLTENSFIGQIILLK